VLGCELCDPDSRRHFSFLPLSFVCEETAESCYGSRRGGRDGIRVDAGAISSTEQHRSGLADQLADARTIPRAWFVLVCHGGLYCWALKLEGVEPEDTLVVPYTLVPQFSLIFAFMPAAGTVRATLESLTRFFAAATSGGGRNSAEGPSVMD